MPRWTPTRNWVLNECVSRIPVLDTRMRMYRRLGMTLDPDRVTIMMHTQVFHPRHIRVGPDTIVGRDCWLDGRGGLTVGASVNISSHTMLITGRHDVHDPQFTAEFAPIVVEDYAWLASRTIVLAGVTVGRGAVAAAGAIVTRDLEPMTIYAGVPAKPIGERRGEPEYALRHRSDWA